jgi:predicted DNA-binding protein
VATRNITLALPEETLREVKVIAAKRGTSVSAMLREKLEALVQEESGYARARREALEALKHGYDLGTYGKASWTRDELHER